MRKTIAIALMLGALLSLTGCGLLPAVEALLPAAATPVPVTAAPTEIPATPEPTPTPESTPEPTPEPTPIPTPTPVPTPEPTPEPVPMTREELDEAMFAADKLCAVAFLGYDHERLNVSAPGLLATGGYNWMYPFLGETKSVQMVEFNGDELFAIVPRSDVSLALHEYFMSTDYTFREGAGGLLATSRDGQPLILRCNTSDTLPNTILLLNGGGTSAAFVPRVALSDGSLLRTSDKVMDITMYDFTVGE